MSESDDSERPGGRAIQLNPAAGHRNQPAPATVSFNRAELNAILRVYGRKVAAGEWRDYAIDQLSDEAVFSVYRRSAEMPLYRILKQPRLARRQGAYTVMAAGGLILKRGHDLRVVLRVLEPHLRLVEA